MLTVIRRNIRVPSSLGCQQKLLDHSRNAFTLPFSSFQIPTLDLALPRAQVVESLRRACLEHGFFLLANSGISAATVSSVFDMSRRFFALPLEQKMAVRNPAGTGRGYTPLMAETLDPVNSKKPDIKESFYLGRTIPPHRYHEYKLYGPTILPDERLIPGFQRVLFDYWHAQEQLCLRLVSLLRFVRVFGSFCAFMFVSHCFAVILLVCPRTRGSSRAFSTKIRASCASSGLLLDCVVAFAPIALVDCCCVL